MCWLALDSCTHADVAGYVLEEGEESVKHATQLRDALGLKKTVLQDEIQ